MGSLGAWGAPPYRGLKGADSPLIVDQAGVGPAASSMPMKRSTTDLLAHDPFPTTPNYRASVLA